MAPFAISVFCTVLKRSGTRPCLGIERYWRAAPQIAHFEVAKASIDLRSNIPVKQAMIAPNDIRHIAGLYDAALTEAVDVILEELAMGRRPKGSQVPQVSIRENGLPSISDAPLFERNGPLEYTSLLEPRHDDEEGRKHGKFPPARFPAFHSLVSYITKHLGVTPAFAIDEHNFLHLFKVQMQIEGAANLHFLRYGETASTERSRTSVLRFVYAGIFQKRLDLALLAPIAFVRFDFDRIRLGPDAFLIRMSEGLQQARWLAKAHGASGHESVLAAATHAVVFKGWGIENDDHWNLIHSLSRFTQAARDTLDLFFGALRLETGVETGYAQEMRLARRWRSYPRVLSPEVYGVGARRYPEAFDDFGWMRETVPLITRDQMRRVRKTWSSLRDNENPRLKLAVRRFNSASLRHDPADAVLDATIGLEILLGDADGQAIAWKLRTRAAALAGINGTKEAMEEARKDVGELYEFRSAIVHGSSRKKSYDPSRAREQALKTLTAVLQRVIAFPRYLDPIAIDRELLMIPSKERDEADR